MLRFVGCRSLWFYERWLFLVDCMSQDVTTLPNSVFCVQKPSGIIALLDEAWYVYISVGWDIAVNCY